jgi:hypothetical protein
MVITKIRESTAPNPPASLGVAQPPYRDPMIPIMIKTNGSTLIKEAKRSFHYFDFYKLVLPPPFFAIFQIFKDIRFF